MSVPVGAPGIRRGRRRVRQPFQWADVERGFRFGLGLLAALACGYFLLYLIAYFQERHEWVDALTRWIRLRF